MNIRGGYNNISRLIASDQPIPYIPIEIYSDNVVNENVVLTILEGAKLPIGDLYLDRIATDYYGNGAFSIHDYYHEPVLNLKS